MLRGARRGCLTAVVLAAVAVCVVACPHFGSKQRLGPSRTPAFGVRVTDGQLRLWTGAPCTLVPRVAVRFSDDAQLVLQPPPGQLADIEYLTIGGPYPGLDVVTPLPDGFDWRAAPTVELDVFAGGGEHLNQANLDEVIEGSADHPDDTYFFPHVGWLNPGQVAQRNGRDFLAACTPDPDPLGGVRSLPPHFGARVTDGKLRLWTGSPCHDVSWIEFVFRPIDYDTADEVSLTLWSSAQTPVTVEHLTFGEPVPGLEFRDPPPADLDWRSWRGLTMIVDRQDGRAGSTNDFAEVVANSARYPSDTYWFEDVGWLDAAQFDALDGIRIVGSCSG